MHPTLSSNEEMMNTTPMDTNLNDNSENSHVVGSCGLGDGMKRKELSLFRSIDTCLSI